jgi:hypothetical protein
LYDEKARGPVGRTGSGVDRKIQPLTGVLVVLAVLLLGAAIPRQTLALESYVHGTVTQCGDCHMNGHTTDTPTNEDCLTCHPGFSVPRKGLLCWTCHTPGQDMSQARSNAACTSACHLPDGTTVTHSAHPDKPGVCTSCHPLSASPSDPAGSPHHTVPAPILGGFSPASGPAGTAVTLTGGSFTDAAIVRFGGVSADFVVDSDTQISAVVPANAVTGPVSVLSAGGEAVSAQAFVVTVAPTPVPVLTLEARPGLVFAGRRVRISSRLTPAGLSGAVVSISVQRRVGGVWKAAATVSRTPDSSGACAWSYMARRAGTYKARAALSPVPSSGAVVSSWVKFRAK